MIMQEGARLAADKTPTLTASRPRGALAARPPVCTGGGAAEASVASRLPFGRGTDAQLVATQAAMGRRPTNSRFIGSAPTTIAQWYRTERERASVWLVSP